MDGSAAPTFGFAMQPSHAIFLFRCWRSSLLRSNPVAFRESEKAVGRA
jgi:hypothetical protein